MDLRDYLRVLRKGWPLILAFVVLGLAAGIGLTLSTTKVYQANSQVYIAVSRVPAVTPQRRDRPSPKGLAQNAPSFLSSPVGPQARDQAR